MKDLEYAERQSHQKLIAALILNSILIVLFVPGCIISFISNGIAGNFVYYTLDSNIFLWITAIIFVISAVSALKRKEYHIPRWVHILKYLATCCIAMTFIVVAVVLCPQAPSYGYTLAEGYQTLMFSGGGLYQHFLSPVVAIISFIIFERKPALEFRVTFIALIPTLVYAAVLYPLNIWNVVYGPYPFLYVHEMPAYMAVIWFLIMCVIAYVIALVLWLAVRQKRKS